MAMFDVGGRPDCSIVGSVFWTSLKEICAGIVYGWVGGNHLPEHAAPSTQTTSLSDVAMSLCSYSVLWCLVPGDFRLTFCFSPREIQCVFDAIC